MTESDVARLLSGFDMSGGDLACWPWLKGKTRGGYGRLWVGGLNRYTHRLMYAHFVGPVPEGLDILHGCDFRACGNPNHLRPGTGKENMRDRDSRGRGARGERVGTAKLSDDQVDEIRCRYAYGESRYLLAKAFGVNWSTIDKIVKGRIRMPRVALP